MRIAVEALRINGRGQSKGLLLSGLYHASLRNVSLSRVSGCALACYDVRETDLYSVSVNHSSSLDEPLVNISYGFGKGSAPLGRGGSGRTWSDGLPRASLDNPSGDLLDRSRHSKKEMAPIAPKLLPHLHQIIDIVKADESDALAGIENTIIERPPFFFVNHRLTRARYPLNHVEVVDLQD